MFQALFLDQRLSTAFKFFYNRNGFCSVRGTSWRCKRTFVQIFFYCISSHISSFQTLILCYSQIMGGYALQTLGSTQPLTEISKKGKAVPLQAWSGPDGSRKLRFPDFMTTAQDGGKVVSLMHRPPLPPGNAPG